MKYDFDEIINRENTGSVKYDGRRHYFGSDDLIPMWVADMDLRIPDFIINAIKERADHPVYGYTVRTDQYYNSVTGWMKKRFNWNIHKNHIIYTPGIVSALNMCVMAYTDPGDEVIVQPPVYFPFFSAVKNNERELIYNPLALKNGRYYMDLDDFRKKAGSKVKMMFLCHPHNPGGMVWTREELEELADICLKNDIIVVSDEIHSDLVFPPHKHIPFATLSDKINNITVACTAPSKTFNLAGLSTSNMIIRNRELMIRFMHIMEKLHVGNGNIFGAVAMQAAYDHGEEWLEQLLEYLQGNIDFVDEYLRANIPEIKAIKPEATYLVWLDCRDLGMEPKQLRDFFIYKAKVGFSDGATFGPGGEGFQRMNIACPRSVVEEALERIRKALNPS